MKNSGFTLIEALVALAVIAIVGIAALETQVTTLLLEKSMRDTQTLRFAVSRILSISRETPPGQTLDGLRLTNGPVLMQVSSQALTNGPLSGQWLKWELHHANRPALHAEIFTHANAP